MQRRHKFKILALFGLSFLVIISAFIYYSYYNNQYSIQKHIQSYKDDSNLIFKYTLEEFESRYKAHIQNSFSTPNILEAIKNKDTKALLSATKDEYLKLNSIYNITHNMHFHSKDSISILRLHKEDKFGDDLNSYRPIIEDINTLIADRSALEVGRYGIFYRVVSAYISNFEHIGSIEIGIEPMHFIKKIEKYLNVSSMLLIKTKELSALEDKSIIKGSIDEYSIIYKNRFCPDIQNLIDLKAPISIVHRDNKTYLINSELNFTDHNGDVIAKMVLAYDISEYISKNDTLVINTILIVILALIIILLIVNFLIDILIKETNSYQKELISKNSLLESIIDSINSPISYKDSDFRYKLVNQAFANLTNSSKEKIIDSVDEQIFDKKLSDTLRALDKETLYSATLNTTYHKIATSGANTIHMLTTKTPLRDDSGSIVGIVSYGKDISAYNMIEENLTNITKELNDNKKELEDKIFDKTKELKFSQDRLLEANKELSSQLKIIDKYVLIVTTNRLGEVLDISRSYLELNGYSKSTLMQKGLSILRDPDFPIEVYQELWRCIKGGNIWSGEIKNRDANNNTYWLNMQIFPIFDDYGEIVKFQAISTNITDKKIIQELAITDELTTLYNRRYFNQKIEEYIQKSKDNSKYLNFIMFDIDHFKLYNDHYGHQQGDIALKSVAKAFKNICKDIGLTFRLGGEEFGLLSISESKHSANDIANKLKEHISSLNIEHKHNKGGILTISIGQYITKIDNNIDSNNIYKSCDELLYKAKRNGRNMVCSNRHLGKLFCKSEPSAEENTALA
jgi:diguanylate cyclase (GGDEF)-like protein/PAS domain S-box-containing protein